MDAERFVIDLLRDNPQGLTEKVLRLAWPGRSFYVGWALNDLEVADIVVRIGLRYYLQRLELGGEAWHGPDAAAGTTAPGG